MNEDRIRHQGKLHDQEDDVTIETSDGRLQPGVRWNSICQFMVVHNTLLLSELETEPNAMPLAFLTEPLDVDCTILCLHLNRGFYAGM